MRGVWIYLRYVLDELREGYRSIDDIDSLPGDLFSYYAESLLADHDDRTGAGSGYRCSPRSRSQRSRCRCRY